MKGQFKKEEMGTIEEGRNQKEELIPYEGLKPEEVENYIPRIERTLDFKRLGIYTVQVDFPDRVVNKWAIVIQLHIRTQNEELRIIAGKFPFDVPDEIPILFLLGIEKKTPYGSSPYIKDKKIFYRDHPKGLEFMSPRRLAIFQQQVEERRRIISEPTPKLLFAKWMVQNGRISDWNVSAGDKPQPIEIAPKLLFARWMVMTGRLSDDQNKLRG